MTDVEKRAVHNFRQHQVVLQACWAPEPTWPQQRRRPHGAARLCAWPRKRAFSHPVAHEVNPILPLQADTVRHLLDPLANHI